jgi:ATP-binding cassette subfamily F protein 3
MSILSIERVALSFGAFDVFQGITGTIPNDGKIGLIGPNGIGKTSLLLILAGLSQPTAGKVHLARGRRLGYLRQEAVEAFADRDHTVYEEMLAVFAGLQSQQEHLYALESEMAGPQVDEQRLERLLEEYGHLQEGFEAAGGYDYEVRIQSTLEGLGLGKKHWQMPLSHLSGGQKTRALLARLLLEKPDLLMLDEPTNHLDLEAIEWLEHTLREWEGAALIVSHDRFFLDNTVGTIWEMSRGGIEIYPGNYSAYLLQRQERWEYLERVYKEEKARLLKEADFIQRNWVRASTHARALGRLRLLSRDLALIEQAGILALRNGSSWGETGVSVERPLDVVEAIRKVNGIQQPSSRPLSIRPRLAADRASGNLVLRSRSARLGYPGHSLFTIRDLELRRGECAALIGPNGSGKTTFLKALLGQLEPLEGELRLGAGLKIGYFAQAHDSLNGERSVLDELISHKEMPPGPARSYLAGYLFRGDDVFKPVSALSGGERARLALAILALEGSNFLLLDEPTNHLDIPAREALQEVLNAFPGTILLVSHDRYLIDGLATQIWEVRAGRLEVFQGSFRDWTLRRPAGGNVPALGRLLPRTPLPRTLLPPKPLVRGDSHADRQKIQAMTRLEERIREQEKAVQRLSHELQKNGQVYERAHKLSWQLAQAQVALDGLMAEWERLVV